jgi:hypothetical protein
MSVKETPPRQKKEDTGGFKVVRVQRLPENTLQGYSPVYAMNEQLQKFAPGEKYEKVEEKSNEVFDFYRVPLSAWKKVEKGRQQEANERLVRTDLNLTTAPGTKRTDTVTEEPQTLDQFGSSLPTSVE